MPRRDGTGPVSQKPGPGRGAGRGGQRGAITTGPAGCCTCPKCGEKTLHTAGIPCTSMKCPRCGTAMIRGA